MRSVEAEAPIRIDLAGGTLDLPPLDLLVPGASTLNVAINLSAIAKVCTIDDGWEVRSVDQGVERRFENLEALAQDSELPLLTGLLAHCSPDPGVRLETRCASPAGAGLGGSSALAVAVAGALTAYEEEDFEAESVLAVARDVETRVLGVPAGVQDYVAALRGGVCNLQFGVGGMVVDALDVDLAELRRRSVLVYSGLPRSSGINNWQVTKSFLDGDAQVRTHLEGIARATEQARVALVAGDLEELARAVDDEWSHRRQLAPGVSTDAIDSLLEAARAAGGLAGKVCGAGGGGCVFLLTAEGRRGDVEAAAKGLGLEVLEFDYTARGLSVVA
jgi:D-glycero-alpha-D-manno-heptose-7-phosphate kinase